MSEPSVHIIDRGVIDEFAASSSERLRKRIAAIRQSLPELIRILDREPDGNYKIIDLLPTLRNPDVELAEIYQLVTEFYPDLSTAQIEQFVLEPAIAFRLYQVDSSILFFLKLDLREELIQLGENPVLVNLEVQTVLDRVEQAIQQNAVQIQEEAAQYAQLEQIDQVPLTSEFAIYKSKFVYGLQLQDLTLVEVFNAILLTPRVPFASLGDFYKLYRYANPPRDWDNSLAGVIWFKVAPPEVTLFADVEPDYSAYVDVYIYQKENESDIDTDPDLNCYQMEFSLNSENKQIEWRTLIRDVEQVLQKAQKPSTSPDSERAPQLSKIGGTFYVLGQSIEKKIFQEVVMNDPIISAVLAIDESTTPDKKKENVFVFYQDGAVRASIIAKSPNDSKLPQRVQTQIRDFPTLVNDLLAVHVTVGETLEQILAFQQTLPKLLGLYNRLYPSVLESLRYFIPKYKLEFLKFSVDVQKEKVFFKDLDPILYNTDYTTKCNKKYQPKILAPGETTDREVMVYPKEDVVVDGQLVPARAYYCDGPENIYPGLLPRDGDHLDVLPYYPCCYRSQHSASDRKLYTKYYYPERYKGDKEAAQQTILKTNKFAQAGYYGNLPSSLRQLLESMVRLPNSQFQRRGIKDAPYSFLLAVLEGSGSNKSLEVVERVLAQLRSPAGLAASRQQTWDISLAELEASINTQTYLDPELFLPVVEQLLQLNIYMFDREGEIKVPRAVGGYYTLRRSGWKSVLIYVHRGETSDNAKHPRSELIVYRPGGASDVSIFEPSSLLSRAMARLFAVTQQLYVLDRPIAPQTFTPPNAFQLTAQFVDTSGKCRAIWARYVESVEFTLYTTGPMQPLLLPLRQLYAIRTIDAPTLGQIFQLGREVVQRVCALERGGYQVELRFGDVDLILPVTEATLQFVPGSFPLESGPTEVVPIPKSADTFSQYRFQRKFIRYIVEYSYWLYSSYILQLPEETKFSDKTVLDFARERLIVVDDPNAWLSALETLASGGTPLVSRNFTRTDTPILDAQGRIQLDAEETRSRLIYTLRLAVRRQRAKLRQYHQKTRMENYFVDISDMDQYPTQVLFQGEGSLSNWINRPQTSNILYEVPYLGPGNRRAYFMRIESKVYLVQPTADFEQAVYVGLAWDRDGNNIRQAPPQEGRIPFRNYQVHLCAFRSPQDVSWIKVTDYGSDYSVYVLGFLFQGVPHYSALLTL